MFKRGELIWSRPKSGRKIHARRIKVLAAASVASLNPRKRQEYAAKAGLCGFRPETDQWTGAYLSRHETPTVACPLCLEIIAAAEVGTS